MKAVLIACLLIASTLCVQRIQMSNAAQKKVETLRASKTWGGFMLNLGELHLMAQGPVDTLVTAIAEVLEDLDRKHAAADEAFGVRTNEHETEVRRLTTLINEANRQIADTESSLANVLRPQEAQLQESIADRERFVVATEKYVEEQRNVRVMQVAEFVQRTQEGTEAVAALQECLELLGSLNSGANSFIQVKQAKKSVEKLTAKLGKSADAVFIKALVELSNSDFANSAMLNNVMTLMTTVQSSLVQGLFTDRENEDANVKAFGEDMTRCSNDMAAAQVQLAELNVNLDQTQEQIAAAEQYILDRTADRNDYQAELDRENASYEEATNQYNDLVAQFNKEEDGCKQALAVLQGAEFADYISNRMQMDRVIDNAHGSGVATGAGSFNFQNNRLGL